MTKSMSENCPGTRYGSLVPDMLDLHECAELGINGLSGPTDQEATYDTLLRKQQSTGTVIGR
jgi:hypothetical protein